jgi:two-component system nitrate/nitrite response regulator NarL
MQPGYLVRSAADPLARAQTQPLPGDNQNDMTYDLGKGASNMESKRSQRVLLADDLNSVRSSLRLLLEQRTNAQVVGEAADALGLLLLLEQTAADIVFLDWELPGLPASHLLRLLHYEHPSLSIIAMSSRPEARAEALSAGIAVFLSKSMPSKSVLDALVQASPEPPDLLIQPG